MTPAARVQASIEILDQVIASARDEGPPADTIVERYFKTRRYAGSKDRRAVRELVYLAIRAYGEPPASGRTAFVGLSKYPEYAEGLARRSAGVVVGDLGACFDGSPHGPVKLGESEHWLRPMPLAGWATGQVLPTLNDSSDEAMALLDRAPLDLRVNVGRTGREEMAVEFEGVTPTPISPWGLRLPADTRVDNHPAYQEGLIEIQDEGSQLIALACQPQDGLRILDLCAGAGGKSLALAAAAPVAEIVATDTNRQRLAQLPPRAERAGATIVTRLLDGGRESSQLADLEGQCDIVLVDAPCSGSGTWRRNPEGRWRLTAERLDRLVRLQARLLDIAAPLVRPGGALVYATCSLIRAEGADQARNFLGRRSSWIVQDVPFDGGRADGPGRLLTPAHDATDGFFVARLVRPC
jgi:16S rRNA (cytosine967-C5)-methyltransferase